MELLIELFLEVIEFVQEFLMIVIPFGIVRVLDVIFCVYWPGFCTLLEHHVSCTNEGDYASGNHVIRCNQWGY